MAKHVEDALRVLREQVHLNGLHFNSFGAAELVVKGDVSIFFNRISDSMLELSVRLDALRGLDEGLMCRMLQANADCGEAARFAIEDECNSPILCSRLEVRLYDDEALLNFVSRFIDTAVYWRGEAGDLLVRGAPDFM